MSHNGIDIVGGEIILGNQEYVECVFAPCRAVHSMPCIHHFITRTNWAFVVGYSLRKINWNELRFRTVWSFFSPSPVPSILTASFFISVPIITPSI